MNRRTLLAAAVASTALAGCLDATSETDGTPSASDDGGPGTTDRAGSDRDEYAECTAPFVEYDELSGDLAAEVDAALDDGSYETDDGLLYDRAVSADTPLWTGDKLYDHEVTHGDGTTRLEFERRTEFASSRDVSVSNETDESLAVTVTVADGDRNRCVDEETSVGPDERKRLSGVTTFGEYDVEIELEDGRRETASWEVPPPHVIIAEGVTVSITDDELTVAPHVSSYDYVPCSSQWNRS